MEISEDDERKNPMMSMKFFRQYSRNEALYAIKTDRWYCYSLLHNILRLLNKTFPVTC